MFKGWFKKQSTEDTFYSKRISSEEKRLGRPLSVEENMQILNDWVTTEMIERQSRHKVIPIRKICFIVIINDFDIEEYLF